MAQLFDTVRPGDLITAGFMNSIIAELNSLESRVSVLEAGQPSGSALTITALVPDGTLQVGQELRVVGRNFGYVSGAIRVTIDGVPVNAFKAGTSDQLLIFAVPPVPNLPGSGRLVLLVVTNQQTSAQRAFVLLPAPVTVTGAVDLTWMDVQPNPIAAGGPAAVRYHIKSRANVTASYNISPTISNVANVADWSLAVLDGNQAPLQPPGVLQLNPGQEEDFYVQIKSVPAGATTFSLQVSVASASGTVTNSDGPRPIPVGSNVPIDDPTITASPPVAETGQTIDSKTAPPTLQVAQGTTARVGVTFTLTVQGTYNVTTQTDNPAGWQSVLDPQTTAPQFQIQAGDLANPNKQALRQLEFLVNPLAGAGAAAGGTVTFVVQRVGAASGRTVPLKLALA